MMNIYEKIKNQKYLKCYYVPFIVFYIIASLISWSVVIHPGDDTVYREGFRIYGGIKGWIQNYTALWSGRIIPHLLLVVFLNFNIAFWKIANSIIYLVLALGIFNMVINTNDEMSDKKKSVIATFVCGMIFFLPVSVMSQGATWVGGSFTYLWPITFGIIALIPFKRLITGEKTSKIMMAFSLLSSVYASYIEQTAAVMLVFSGVMLVYCIFAKIKCKIYHYFMFILMGINAFISVSAEGNSVRAKAEILRFYPDFDMLSLIDKVYLGVNVTLSHIFESSTILMLILSVLIILLVAKKANDKVTLAMSTMPLIYTASKFFSVEDLFVFEDTNKLYIGGIFQYKSVILAIIVCLICLYMFFVIFDKCQDSIIIGLLFSGALCSGLVIGLSPTVYASGSRVFFLTDILIVLCISKLISFYMEKYYEKSSKNTAIIIGFIAISLIIAINYLINVAPNQL